MIRSWTKSSSKLERGRAIISSSQRAAMRKTIRRVRLERTTWDAAQIQILWRTAKSVVCTTAIPTEDSKWIRWTPHLQARTFLNSRSLCLTRTPIRIRRIDRQKDDTTQMVLRSREQQKRKTKPPWATDIIRQWRSTLPSTAQPKSESSKMWKSTITTENTLWTHSSISATNSCASCSKIRISRLRNSTQIMPWGWQKLWAWI